MRIILAAALLAATLTAPSAQASDRQYTYAHLGELSLAGVNVAEVTITGDGNAFGIVQEIDAGSTAEPLGNSLTLEVLGDGNGDAGAFAGSALRAGLKPGRLLQQGQGNAMSVSLLGDANLFAATQMGTGNRLTGAITGTANQAAILQTGHANVAAFTQTGQGNTLGIVQRSW